MNNNKWTAVLISCLVMGCSQPDSTELNDFEQELTRLDNEIMSLNAQIEALNNSVAQLETGNPMEQAVPEASRSTSDDQNEDETNRLSKDDIDWYEAFSKPYEDRDFFNSDDPEVYDIATYFEDRELALIELITRHPYSSYLVSALGEVLTEATETILLDYMDDDLELMSLALQRNLQDSFPSYFYSSFERLARSNDGYIPTELIDFIAENNFERYEDDIKDYALNGLNPNFTFDALEKANYPEIAALAIEVWKQPSNDFGWEDSRRAFVAAKYAGERKALEDFIFFCVNEPEDEQEYVSHDFRELIKSSMSMEEIYQQQDKLAYSDERKVWMFPS
jgi:outer membrane murein-binding lipoprotein Lpp